jgi:amino acid adenylation domain-containing protein/non-ribosomal peptide synthase protein (TIGR01720 family)
MNNFKDSTKFFNELRLHAGAIWLENDRIRFSAPKTFQNQTTDDFITSNKNQLIAILKENSILSKRDFLDRTIFSDTTRPFYPLSPAQERLWFIEQYEEGTNAYHIPTIYELDATTDKEGVKYALQQIVSRHEVLRSTIEQIDGQDHGIQIVHKEELSIEEVQLNDADDYEELIKEDINRPFSLSSEYPIRVKFYNITSSFENVVNKNIVLINMHHIVSDGWSEVIFEKQLWSYYEAYVKNDKLFSLPALEIQYKDYAVWQRSYLTGETLEKQLSFWRNKLAGYQTLEFSTDYARPDKTDYKGAAQEFKISKETSQQLRTLAKNKGFTVHSLLLSSMNILLSKYTGQDDIVIGSIIANRHYRQTEELIGFFVNTQVNRTLLNKTQSFEELIQQVYQEQVEAQLYQDLPFDKLLNELSVERSASRHPIFQVMFDVQNVVHANKNIDQPKQYFKHYRAEDVYEVEKFDLSITITDDSTDELIVYVSYATSLFKKNTIVSFIRHYQHLLKQLIDAPGKPYSQLSLLLPEEYQQIIYDWNVTENEFPKDKTIHELFEEQVSKTPDHTALVYEGQTLSYRQLNEKSNQLARHIRAQYESKAKKSLNSDTLIVVCLDRSLEMIIGILAVLKAGATYVPVDPSYPQERIDHVLDDTKADFILTQKYPEAKATAKLPAEKLIYIDLSETFYNREDSTNLPQHSKANDLAYVIYTSGTTGKPKGVLVQHAGVNNEILSQLSMIPLTSSDKSLLTANIIFDAAAECIYMSLFSGGQLYIVNSTTLLDLTDISKYIERKQISVLNTTPSYLRSINIPLFSEHLKYIILGGEAYQKIETNAKVYNTYGPTEASIVSTGCEVLSNGPIHIGKSIQNSKAYILSSENIPVPVGVIGELYLGGAGIARGYLNLPELTAERFVSNPFATVSDKAQGYTRLYRTGDLVRWLPDGNIEYIGRNDDQVKIRGYRIELGEVENALTQLEGIQQACVLAKEKTTGSSIHKYLVGYYVLDTTADIDESSILKKLSERLPEYMVPASLVAMPSFPLTINGKLDKKALPDPEFSSSPEEYVAPTNEMEALLAGIWERVLGLDKISINSNFFRIGGDSILSIQVSSRIRQTGIYCRVKEIFECKTIAKLAAYLNKKKLEVSIQSEQGTLTGELGLLPIQEWFVEKVSTGELVNFNHWNQSFLIRVPVLDSDTLKRAINELVVYHDVLRICYSKEAGAPTNKPDWKQYYQSEIDLPKLQTLDVSEHTEAEIYETLTSWQSGFDLENGNLFQVGYLHGYADGSSRVYFALHHLIVDGVSWRILSEDLKTLIEGKSLPSKGSSYRQWVDCIKTYPEKYSSEQAYWANQLEAKPNYLSESHELSLSVCEFDKSLTTSLLQESSKAYHTEVNDLLLTALAYALKEINHQDIQCITLEGHGREDIDSSIDHSRTVGWFTTMFPVKLELKNTLKGSIQFIKEILRSIPNKGIGFGAFATQAEAGYSHKDLPLISFNYLGQFDARQEEWQIVSEQSGSNVSSNYVDHNIININGDVSNGKLSFSFRTKLGDSTTTHLRDSFKMHLIKIIDLCREGIEKEESGYTPSDFKSVKISQALLDKLQLSSK